jgi:hypothetical protein
VCRCEVGGGSALPFLFPIPVPCCIGAGMPNLCPCVDVPWVNVVLACCRVNYLEYLCCCHDVCGNGTESGIRLSRPHTHTHTHAPRVPMALPLALRLLEFSETVRAQAAAAGKGGLFFALISVARMPQHMPCTHSHPHAPEHTSQLEGAITSDTMFLPLRSWLSQAMRHYLFFFAYETSVLT